MTLKNTHSRKAISPLIASVLLILFVTGLATVILSWLSVYLKDVTEETSRDSDRLMSCSGAVIEISKLYILNGSDNNQTFRMVINNIGSVPLDVKEILLMNSSGYTCNFNLSGLNTTVETGKPLTLASSDICQYFLDHNNKKCSDLDHVIVYTNCESARATIKYNNDPKISCRH